MNLNQKKYWQMQWKMFNNTLIEKDVFYLMDEIKLEYLLPLLPKTARTIEVGAGSGRLSCFLALHNYETVCLDYLPEALGVAKNNYKLAGVKGTFIVGNATDLPFEDNSFDVVLSTGLLEHYRNPFQIVHEMIRVLKKGGLFYSDIVPNKLSSLRLFRCRKSEEVYEARFAKKDVIKLLQDLGLQNIEVFSAGVFPPIIPLVRRLAFVRLCEAKMLYSLKSLWKSIDKTIIADRLGFYYFAYGYKQK